MYRFRYVVTTQSETVFYADYITKRKINDNIIAETIEKSENL